MAKVIQLAEPLDVDNYHVWKPRMKYVLITEDLWSAVTDDLDAESSATRDGKGKAADREQKSEMAKAIIGLNVTDFHLQTVEAAASAKALWETLEASFKAKTFARRLQLPKYLARARTLMLDLRGVNTPIEESEVALQVLAGLPRGYAVIVSVLTFQDQLDLDGLLPQLLIAEQRLQEEAEQVGERPTATAFGAVSVGQSCSYCKQKGHAKSGCPKLTVKQTKPTVVHAY